MALAPAARLPFQSQQLLNVGVDVFPPDMITFQLAVTLAGSLNPSCTVQPLIAPGPVLVTVTSSWYPVPQSLTLVIVHVVAPIALVPETARIKPKPKLSLRNMKFPSYPVEQLLVMAMQNKSTESGSLHDA